LEGHQTSRKDRKMNDDHHGGKTGRERLKRQVASFGLPKKGKRGERAVSLIGTNFTRVEKVSVGALLGAFKCSCRGLVGERKRDGSEKRGLRVLGLSDKGGRWMSWK